MPKCFMYYNYAKYHQQTYLNLQVRFLPTGIASVATGRRSTFQLLLVATATGSLEGRLVLNVTKKYAKEACKVWAFNKN